MYYCPLVRQLYLLFLESIRKERGYDLYQNSTIHIIDHTKSYAYSNIFHMIRNVNNAIKI